MSDDQNKIDIIASALVREYLATKKILKTLKHMDLEYPRCDQSINSRQKLARCLDLCRPIKGVTILEALVLHIIQKSGIYNVGISQREKSINFDDPSCSSPHHYSTSVPLEKTEIEEEREHKWDEKIDLERIISREEIITREDVIDNAKENDKLAAVDVNKIDPACCDEEECLTLQDPRPSSPNAQSANSCSITETAEPHETSINETKAVHENIEFNENTEIDHSTQFDKNTGNQTIETSSNNSIINESARNSLMQNTVHISKTTDVKLAVNDTLQVDENEQIVVSIPPQRVATPPDGATPLALPAAMQLKEIILGDSEAYFPSPWKEEGIAFTGNFKLKYGLQFHKEGTSGALAALQGFVLKSLLFSASAASPYRAKDEESVLDPSAERVRAALVTAVSDVLWQCGQRRRACLAVPTNDGEALLTGHGRYRRDGVTEGLLILQLEGGLNEVREIVEKHLHLLQAPGGCALFLCSAVLSRGLSEVADDMGDKCAALLAHGGECAPELVSLVLTGRATMRQEKGGDTRVPRGVPARADVGLLALAEHYGHCQVGSFLKTPRYPIWLVLSQGRYSVLFSTRRQLVSDWRAELAFRLHLYAGSRQQDPLQLAVSTVGGHDEADDDRTRSPIELVIRTKWTGASVHWVNNNEEA